MPVFANEQRKNQFINDTVNMIYDNSTFGIDKNKTNVNDVFADVRNYFAKGKDETSRKLAGYVQNFMAVYTESQMTIGDAEGAHVNTMVTNIKAMQGFKAAFDQYIRANKYTALKNKNVKMLSAMVQVADDMASRVGMEQRSEDIQFINGQLSKEKTVHKSQQEAYPAFIEECVKNEVDFVDPVHTYNELNAKLQAAQIKYDHWSTLHNQLANNPNADNSKDAQVIEDCTKQLLDFEKKMKAAESRAKALLDLKSSFKIFRQADNESQKQVTEYKNKILDNKLRLSQNEKALKEAQRIIESNNDAGERARELLNSSDDLIAFDKANEKLSEYKYDIQLLNDLVSANITPHNMADPNHPFSKLYRSAYNEAKRRLCEAEPKLESAFETFEKDPGKTFSDFMNKNNSALVGIKENLEIQISGLGRTKDVQEFNRLTEAISQIKANANNIDVLTADNKKLQEDIELNEKLITSTKINSSVGKQITDALGFVPNVKTEQELLDIMDEQRKISQNELSEMKNSSTPGQLQEKMNAAQQRIDDRNVENVEKHYVASKTECEKLNEKLKIVGNLVQKRNDLKKATDALVDRRQTIKSNHKSLDSLDPSQEVYDRLKGIQERFQIKTNGKMTKECTDMMSSLQNAIEAFNPANKENASIEQQKNALEQLQENSGKYIAAKKGQHIPTFFASEQRLLRLSCAEEMQNFSKTAGNMLNDFDKINNKEQADYYMTRSCDDSLRRNMDDNNLTMAAKNVKVEKIGNVQNLCRRYIDGRDKRLRNNEQPSLSNEKKQASMENSF